MGIKLGMKGKNSADGVVQEVSAAGAEGGSKEKEEGAARELMGLLVEGTPACAWLCVVCILIILILFFAQCQSPSKTQNKRTSPCCFCVVRPSVRPPIRSCVCAYVRVALCPFVPTRRIS